MNKQDKQSKLSVCLNDLTQCVVRNNCALRRLEDLCIMLHGESIVEQVSLCTAEQPKEGFIGALETQITILANGLTALEAYISKLEQ